MSMFLRICFIAIVLRPWTVAANDPLHWSELQLLYAADLAIDARFVRQDDAHVWMRVVSVLRDKGHGIATGDHIRVDKSASYDCGFAWNIDDLRRWRLYLQKEEGKGHWALSRRNAGSAIHFIHDRAIMHMPAWVELPIAEFDRCMIEFQTCYASADSGNTFTALCDQARIDSLAAHNAILAQFEKQGRTVTAAHLVEPPAMPVNDPAPAPAPIRDCSLLEQPPRPVSTMGAPVGDAIGLKLPDPSPDAAGAHVYLRVLVDAEGWLRYATILRGSTSERDAAALRGFAGMQRVEPGRVGGVATACYEVIRVRFVVSEE